MLERAVVELDDALEGLGRGQERDLGAAPAFRRADDGERRHRLAVAELHDVLLAVAPDAQPSQDESAFTTETPTPCRPPETL